MCKAFELAGEIVLPKSTATVAGKNIASKLELSSAIVLISIQAQIQLYGDGIRAVLPSLNFHFSPKYFFLFIFGMKIRASK